MQRGGGGSAGTGSVVDNDHHYTTAQRVHRIKWIAHFNIVSCYSLLSFFCILFIKFNICLDFIQRVYLYIFVNFFLSLYSTLCIVCANKWHERAR